VVKNHAWRILAFASIGLRLSFPDLNTAETIQIR
jgi:hypothetical protein